MNNHARSPVQSEFQSTATSAGTIGLITLLGAVVSFVLQLLVAYYFGASAETDAFFMAVSTSDLLGKLLLGGSITAVFLPIFVDHLTQGKRTEAWQLALNIFNLSAAVFIVALLILGFGARAYVSFIAPGFDAPTALLTVKLLRVILPAFLFLFLVEMATSILHSLRHFAIPAWVRVLSPATSILLLLLFVRSWGIYALAFSTLVGSIVQLTFLMWNLRQRGLSYRFVFAPFHPLIKKLSRLVYPFIFSAVATQVAGIVYRILVSELNPGSLAALKFAEKITQLLTIMFLTSVTTVIYPLLSQKASRADFEGMKATIGSSIRLVSFVTVPLILLVALLRLPLITLIYQRGSFSAEAVVNTSVALLFLVLGLTINGISSILGHATLALQQTKAAVAVTIASQAIAIYLFVLLVPRLGLAGLSLASSLVPLSITLLYFLYLTRFIPQLWIIFWHNSYAKIGVLGFCLTVVVYALRSLLKEWPASSYPVLILQLVIPSVAGGVVFFGGSLLWRLPEMRELTNILKSKAKKII